MAGKVPEGMKRITMDISDELFKTMATQAGITDESYQNLKYRDRYITEDIKKYLYTLFEVERPLSNKELKEIERVREGVKRAKEKLQRQEDEIISKYREGYKAALQLRGMPIEYDENGELKGFRENYQHLFNTNPNATGWPGDMEGE